MQVAQIHIGQSTGVSVRGAVSLLFQRFWREVLRRGLWYEMDKDRGGVYSTRMMSSCLAEVQGRGERLRQSGCREDDQGGDEGGGGGGGA